MKVDRIISKIVELKNVLLEETGDDDCLQKIGLKPDIYNHFVTQLYNNNNWITLRPSDLSGGNLKVADVEIKATIKSDF